jgi:hypothetical protein
MTSLSSRRQQLTSRYYKAVKAHAPRAHISEELKWVTVQQLQAEYSDPFPVNVMTACALVAAIIVLGLVIFVGVPK